MRKFLGIDHPLVLVRDLEGTATRYEALGFAPRPLGKHPWGTSMRLVQFDQCSIELMSVYDERLIDEKAVEGFAFGRFIRDQLSEREGVSLLALNSNNAEADAAEVETRGIACTGTIDFGREVKLEGGGTDRTRTTLKVLADPALPRLSNFICHQHRPDLVFRPEWQVHPNGTSGINRVTIMADAGDWPKVRARLEGLYGKDSIDGAPGGFGARTGNGDFVVLTKAGVEAQYGELPAPLKTEARPSCVAIHVSIPDVASIRARIQTAGVPYAIIDGEIRLRDAAPYGNVFLAFTDAAKAR